MPWIVPSHQAPVLPWLLPHLPGGAPLHLDALARARPAATPAALARVALSALVGGLTHVFVDGLTHGDHAGWALAFLPWLEAPVPHPGGSAPLHDALQLWLTIALGFLALREWGLHGRRSDGAVPAARVEPAPAAARRAVQRGIAAAALAGTLLGPLLRGAYGTSDALEIAAFGALSFAGLAVVAAAAAERARLALARVREDLGVWLEA